LFATRRKWKLCPGRPGRICWTIVRFVFNQLRRECQVRFCFVERKCVFESILLRGAETGFHCNFLTSRGLTCGYFPDIRLKLFWTTIRSYDGSDFPGRKEIRIFWEPWQLILSWNSRLLGVVAATVYLQCEGLGGVGCGQHARFGFRFKFDQLVLTFGCWICRFCFLPLWRS
jgi:hypothetical protein